MKKAKTRQRDDLAEHHRRTRVARVGRVSPSEWGVASGGLEIALNRVHVGVVELCRRSQSRAPGDGAQRAIHGEAPAAGSVPGHVVTAAFRSRSKRPNVASKMSCSFHFRKSPIFRVLVTNVGLHALTKNDCAFSPIERARCTPGAFPSNHLGKQIWRWAAQWRRAQLSSLPSQHRPVPRPPRLAPR
jgi:hypothetical protein